MTSPYKITIDGTDHFFDGMVAADNSIQQFEYRIVPQEGTQATVNPGLYADSWTFIMQYNSETDHGDGVQAVTKYLALKTAIKGMTIDDYADIDFLLPNGNDLELSGTIGGFETHIDSNTAIGIVNIAFEFAEDTEAP